MSDRHVVKPRAVLYARVSTADKGQDYTAQFEELTAVCVQRGWNLVTQFSDTTSGAQTDRPGLREALERCRRGGVDIFAVVAVDRIARSVRHLLEVVDELEACGVKLSCTREGTMDATTPHGRAFLQVRAIFAELERNITRERVREGLAIRKARGQKLGRPRGLDYGRMEQARALRAQKPPASWTAIARELGGKPGAWSRAVSRAEG